MRCARPRTAASNTKVLVIVLVCVGAFVLVGVLACAGLGFWAFRTGTREVGGAQTAADAFLAQLQAGQVQPAYQATAADFQSQLTFAQFSGFVALNPNLTGHTSRTMSGVQMNVTPGGKQARIQYALTGPGGQTSCTLVLADTGAGWQVRQLHVP